MEIHPRSMKSKENPFQIHSISMEIYPSFLEIRPRSMKSTENPTAICNKSEFNEHQPKSQRESKFQRTSNEHQTKTHATSNGNLPKTHNPNVYQPNCHRNFKSNEHPMNIQGKFTGDLSAICRKHTIQ